MIAACETIKAAPRSDPGYVRHLFDQFSADYDQRMIGQLAYAAPQILLGLAGMVMPGRAQMSVLDLGCGTGLAGMAFKPMAARLDGVDLSPAMIAKARARSIYDRLEVADLESALAAPGPCYDLILAADTLVYLGDLVKVFKAASPPCCGRLLPVQWKRRQGWVRVGPKRRWRHSEGYLRHLAEETGFSVAGLVSAAPPGSKPAGGGLRRGFGALTKGTSGQLARYIPAANQPVPDMVALDNTALWPRPALVRPCRPWWQTGRRPPFWF